MTTIGPPVDVLRDPTAGAKVIRGGALRGLGYGAGVLLGAATSVLLLRYLGLREFGRYATVAALVGIVSGVTDAGLTAVGARELSIRPPGEERRRLLGNLVGLRLVLTPLGVLAAAGFALVAGYGWTLVAGVLLLGAGLVLVNTQATMMMPLGVDLRFGALTGFEVAKHAATLAGVALLVLVGAALLPFFAVQIAVGALVLVLTPLVVARGAGLVPRLDRAVAGSLLRDALPVAAALAMNVVYFRVLVVLVSLVGTATATGLFATSFRIFEVLVGLPALLLSVALPVLSVAGDEDEERLRYALQRLTEAALVAAVPLVLVVAIAAEPAITLIGGEEYREAAPVLRVQAFALIGLFLGQALQLGLLAIRRQAALVWANGAALVVVVGLGALLIRLEGALGAAVAAVVAESLLALVLLALLARARRRVVPSFVFVWRVALAAVIALGALLVPGLPALATAALALVLYGGAALATGALPREILLALRGGRPA